MNKKLAIVLAAVALSVSAAYYVTGKVIQDRLTEAVAKLNVNEEFAISLTSYKRGIFTSKAELEFANQDGSIKQSFAEHITHGPLIIGNTSRGFRISLAAGKIRTTPKNRLQDKLSIITLVDFSQQATTWFNLQDAKEVGPNNFQVTWDALRGELTHDLPITKLSGNLEIPSLKISTDDWQIIIKDLQWMREDDYHADSFNVREKYSFVDLVYIRDNATQVSIGETVLDNLRDNNGTNTNGLVTCNISHAKIVDQEFTNDNFVFSVKNLQSSPWDRFSVIALFNPEIFASLIKHYGTQFVTSGELAFEFPKNFSQALLSYLSFEIYRSSPMGKLDQRPMPEILKAMTTTVHALVKDALNRKLILDKGDRYALNFNLPRR